MAPAPKVPFIDPNSPEALGRRREAAVLTWRGPALMLFARAACAVGAQALVAAVFARRASPAPWHDAEPWMPVYGTLIDAGCLALLWGLTRREGIRLFDLVGFEQTRHLHSWRRPWGQLALVWNAFPALPVRAPAFTGRSLWRPAVPVHLGADRADDVERLPAVPLPGSWPQYDPGDHFGGVRLVGTALLHAADLRPEVHGFPPVIIRA